MNIDFDLINATKSECDVLNLNIIASFENVFVKKELCENYRLYEITNACVIIFDFVEVYALTSRSKNTNT